MHTIYFKDKSYPELLKHIAQPPPVLHYKGSLEALNQTCIAVVGTRINTVYGRQCTEKFIKELAGLQITIISGLALGIDAIAHRAALENGLKTIAVLAHGFNHLHPARHVALANQIIKSGGALISEFAPSIPAYKNNFLQRNGTIAGLSKAVCVVECPIKSGAMNTANHAFDQDKTIYTFPGDISRQQSLGPLMLMQTNRAIPINSASTILKDLEIQARTSILQKIIHSKEEEEIYNLLNSNPKNLQEISEFINKPNQEITQILTILELKGDIIKSSDGYVRTINNNQ